MSSERVVLVGFTTQDISEELVSALRAGDSSTTHQVLVVNAADEIVDASRLGIDSVVPVTGPLAIALNIRRSDKIVILGDASVPRWLKLLGFVLKFRNCSIYYPSRGLEKVNIVSRMISYTSPVNYWPLKWYRRRWMERYRERCLYDRTLAESFRRTYLSDELQVETCRVLDFGCGWGRHSAMLAQLGFSVVAMDIVPTTFWNRVEGVHFLVAGAKELAAFESGNFGLCVCMQVLMYVEDDFQCLKDIRMALAREGYLLLQVTNRDNLYTKITGKFLSDDPFLIRYYGQDEIIQLVEQAGFQVVKTWTEKVYAPIFHRVFNYFYGIVLSEAIQAKLSSLIPARYRGLINVLAQRA